MGGNALKQFGVVRVDTPTLHSVIVDIGTVLTDHGIRWSVPASVGGKNDHGDLDVILMTKDRDKTRKLFEGFKQLKNGPVDSIAYPIPETEHVLQVDLVFVSEDHYDYAISYFCFNDLGNLVGRFAHKLGLKHGHDGLTLVVRDGTCVLGEIVLTVDFEKALEFIGFSFNKFLEGFTSLEDIYTYVSNHPRFSPKMFDLAERNHTARMRDRKRPTYTGFLLWIEKNRGYLGDYDWPLDKSVWMSDIFAAFPEKVSVYNALWDAHRAKELAKTKFNGAMVGQLTGLREKPLGRLIQAFKEAHPDWVEYVNNSSQEDVDKEVYRLYDVIFGDRNE